ncbi:NYN domain-containing protein [Candidatus Viridilinea mediisalina]|uniref:NYN domain-containing protein n=1 Tax=Candidatus Viridilinea mediisalina TaxID=2024553 RepID=A0A2A6RGD1_9CHLR|nr:NYN domain-containing protein [Candidatus Viridilinea mediisalina]PDW01991.1 NYN domain-containing protein [Candidatus Viridilinea mediisalina]
MYEQKRPDVAVFIDFENVYVSVRDKLNANPNFEAIMDRCSDLGRVVISRAYADWYRYPRVTSALYANAIEPIYVATYYYDKDVGRTGRAIKNSVDMNLCIDAMKTLFTNPTVGRFVLVTGDRDFIPLVNNIRQQGKEVYIIGIGGAASTHLAQSADEFVFYEQLVGKQTGGSAMATTIANRGTEFNRGLDPATHDLVPREREREHERETPPVPAPTPAEPDVYTVLIEAIHLVRKRGYVSTLGSIKLVMKELMGGDFKESRYRDLGGRPFAKFKDFVIDAEKRGKVQIFTNGTVNEVFLPGEDPYKLSQFAAALSDDVPPIDPVLDSTISANGRKEKPRSESSSDPVAPAGGRRRRRRSRRSQSSTSSPELAPTTAHEPELEEPDYTPPDMTIPPLAEEVLFGLEALEAPVEPEPEFSYEAKEEQGGEEQENRGTEEQQEEEQENRGTEEQGEEEQENRGTEEQGEEEQGEEEQGEEEQENRGTEEQGEEEQGEEEQENRGTEEQGEEEQQEAVEEPVAEVAHEPAVMEPSEAEAVAQSEAEAAEALAQSEAEEAEALINAMEFSAEEWAIFTEMMRGFSKPTSFQQIFNNLRDQRRAQELNRTNEQLRTMVKQAINTGLLERSGRGKRIYYTLRAEA